MLFNKSSSHSMDDKEIQIRSAIDNKTNEMEALTDRATREDRDMTKSEATKHDQLFNQVKRLGSELRAHVQQREARDELYATTGEGLTPLFDGFGNELSKPGKAAPERTKSKVFMPGEKIQASVTRDAADNITPGQFLRAAMFKPQTDAERNLIQASVTSAGFSLPSFVSAQIIDQLREENPLFMAGARSVVLPQGEGETWVTIEDYPASHWHAELNEEDLGTPVFDGVELKPKTLISLVEISRELEQDSANIEEALRLALVGSLNDAVVAAAFTQGGPNAPRGLDEEVEEETLYTTVPTWPDILAAYVKLLNRHVDRNKIQGLMNPGIWSSLQNQTTTEGEFIAPPAGIANLPITPVAGMPNTIGYFGDFSEILFGFRLNLGLERHTGYSVRKYGAVWSAAMRYDMAVLRPDALERLEVDGT